MKASNTVRRQALAANLNPTSRLSVEAERLLAAVLRGGALPTTAELKAIENSLREVGSLALQAPSDAAKLFAALTHIFTAVARWPQPRSARDAEVQRAAWHVFIKAHSSLKLLQPLWPVSRAASAWAHALLRSDILQCLSRKVHAETQAVCASLHHTAGTGSADGCTRVRLALRSAVRVPFLSLSLSLSACTCKVRHRSV